MGVSAGSAGLPPQISQYAQVNESSHQLAHLFAFTESPSKAYALRQHIVRDTYTNHPSGIIGNDACGQVNACYLKLRRARRM